MLKRKLCEARFTWRLRCPGPLLIADGRYDQKNLLKNADAYYPDKVFISHAQPNEVINQVRAGSQALNLPFYVPGASLRGPVRSQAERIIRSLLLETAPKGVSACDPFEQDNQPLTQSCSKRLELAGEPKYREACPACKLFGCAGLASRIVFTDAELESGYRSVYRDMIGIDRFTGGVYQGGDKGGGANMRFHVLEDVTFTTSIAITNFELWQLGLLAYVLRDFAEGLIAIGFGKTKGFGQVTGETQQITLTYPAGRGGGKVQHLRDLVTSEEAKFYGIADAPDCDCSLQPQSGGALDLYETFQVNDSAAFWSSVAPAFNRFIDSCREHIK